jgi:type I restriction enzyme R subunit
MVRREETAGEIYITGGAAQRRLRGRVDYTLRLKVREGAQPVAVALIEAKAESRAPDAGLEQGKLYARKGNLLHVPFVFSSNGHLFVEYDQFTNLTHAPRPICEFPSPEELRKRYEDGRNFHLTDEAAKPLLSPYPGGEASRRYYQDAAIRAVFEKIAAGGTRALLSLATGTGKTRIAVNLMKRIADAGQLRRALFLCDRDELRTQGLGAFSAVFGADAAPVSGDSPQKNARVLVATYQTLGVAEDTDDASFLTDHYPENYFSHIIIDECHRSAWNKWHQVLTRNPDAVQIGLTATPRKIKLPEGSDESGQDAKILADNVKYFGEPVYEYDIAQGMADGYLAACEVVRRPIFWERQSQSVAQRDISRTDLAGFTLTDARTGAPVSLDAIRERYKPGALEAELISPDRVKAMAEDLWDHLMKTGGPEQKTIIFCARDTHADRVAAALNNL